MERKVTVTREEANEHLNRDAAHMHLESAAQAVKPWGYEYQGSIAVHMFEHPAGPQFTFTVQTVGLANVPEGQADAALKETVRTVAAAYGRTHLKGAAT